MCYNVSIFSDREIIEERFEARFNEPKRYTLNYLVSAFTAPYLTVISTKHDQRGFMRNNPTGRRSRPTVG